MRRKYAGMACGMVSGTEKVNGATTTDRQRGLWRVSEDEGPLPKSSGSDCSMP